MLVPMRAILEIADKYNYAQGAFNVNAVAQAKAVIEVHEMFRSPAILQGADLISVQRGDGDIEGTGYNAGDVVGFGGFLHGEEVVGLRYQNNPFRLAGLIQFAQQGN